MLRIGNLKLDNWLVMAPMAGITNLPFRRIAKKMGAALVFTEMISAMGLMRRQKKTYQYLQSDPFEKPLAVQIFGANPEVMARAAEIGVQSGASIVDINMGCPVKKVVKTGAGGALLRVPHQIGEIISAVRRSCTVPLTVKIRSGWSPAESNPIEIAGLIADCGADAITLHPRFVTQGFSGTADWTVISELKKRLKIPIIGNGDVVSPQLALRMKNQTGCDGVMIGRGAIGNPWIFKQILDMENGRAARPPRLHERKALIQEHYRLLSASVGEIRAAKMFRGFLLWYTKGLPHSGRFRGRVNSIKDSYSLFTALDYYFIFLKREYQ
ncbi:MAG: tRNA dihydrouridine synthase DusB [Desulfatiglandaceae bacterium]|jgi:nifR3 family TIM-barrel protein